MKVSIRARTKTGKIRKARLDIPICQYMTWCFVASKLGLDTKFMATSQFDDWVTDNSITDLTDTDLEYIATLLRDVHEVEVAKAIETRQAQSIGTIYCLVFTW